MSAGIIFSFLAVLALLIFMGSLLSYLTRPADNAQADSETTMIDAVNAVLPQTQCAQCGYPGCRPYATAIIKQHELINRCPPGGERTIAQLSELLGTPTLAMDEHCGVEKPLQLAIIDETTCIGCTLCIHACPVDAIVGAGKYMHTVIAEQCTGCELCLPPCPVDCIDLVAPTPTAANWQWPQPG